MTSDLEKRLVEFPDFPMPDAALLADAQAKAAIQNSEYAHGEREALIEKIKQLLKKRDAVLVAHYYVR